jgi:hypothetical protein
LHSRFGRELGRPGGPPLRLALPYAETLTVAGEPLRLHGLLDLVLGPVLAPTALGRPQLQLVEYRYGYAVDAESPLERLRQQLRQKLGERLFPGCQVVLGSCFLREADPQPRWVDGSAAAAQEEPPAVTVGSQLVSLARLGTTAALMLPVLPQALCQQAGCGYQQICHPQLGVAGWS